ncbi:MAG: hypothetical protein ACK5BN_03730, partial [Planctomycetota bacterium]
MGLGVNVAVGVAICVATALPSGLPSQKRCGHTNTTNRSGSGFEGLGRQQERGRGERRAKMERDGHGQTCCGRYWATNRGGGGCEGLG